MRFFIARRPCTNIRSITVNMKQEVEEVTQEVWDGLNPEEDNLRFATVANGLGPAVVTFYHETVKGGFVTFDAVDQFVTLVKGKPLMSVKLS